MAEQQQEQKTVTLSTAVPNGVRVNIGGQSIVVRPEGTEVDAAAFKAWSEAPDLGKPILANNLVLVVRRPEPEQPENPAAGGG